MGKSGAIRGYQRVQIIDRAQGAFRDVADIDDCRREIGKGLFVKHQPAHVRDRIIELIGGLIDAFFVTRAPVVVPSYKGRRGHPVIFSAATFQELLNAPMDQGARAVVWAHKGKVSEVSTTEEGCILNLNDPNTLAKLGGSPR